MWIFFCFKTEEEQTGLSFSSDMYHLLELSGRCVYFLFVGIYFSVFMRVSACTQLHSCVYLSGNKAEITNLEALLVLASPNICTVCGCSGKSRVCPFTCVHLSVLSFSLSVCSRVCHLHACGIMLDLAHSRMLGVSSGEGELSRHCLLLNIYHSSQEEHKNQIFIFILPNLPTKHP